MYFHEKTTIFSHTDLSGSGAGLAHICANHDHDVEGGRKGGAPGPPALPPVGRIGWISMENAVKVKKIDHKLGSSPKLIE